MDRRITIQVSTVTKEATHGSVTNSWAELATVWAERLDFLPSRAESLRMGLEQSRSLVRYRLRYRGDVNSAMRVVEGTDILRIVGGPSEIGRRMYIELMCERIKPVGGP